jgi:hypothetical protein
MKTALSHALSAACLFVALGGMPALAYGGGLDDEASRSVNTPWLDLSRRADVLKVISEWGGPPQGHSGSMQIVQAADGGNKLVIFGQTTQEPTTRARITSESDAKASPLLDVTRALGGDNHAGLFLADGRLLITFRDTHPASPTNGDHVAWVGTLDDLANGREGQFTCRLVDHRGDPLAASPTQLEALDDGAFLSTAACRLKISQDPVVASVRFTMAMMEEILPTRGYSIPLVDLDGDEGRHVVVDREEGQYLGHVSTQLLEDGKTILAVYPKGHGRGPIVYKRSTDGGRTWSDRLPTPENWATSREVPTIHRVIDPKSGAKRLIVWSGLYPARLAVSEDDGSSWSELQPVGEWGGIVVMGFVERLRDGTYLAMFHDDGRFFASKNQAANPRAFTLYQTFSHDGGLTWTEPDIVWSGSDLHLCEPGCARSPDGKSLAVLMRENSRTRNGYVIFSNDEGQTWSPPRELPASLTGDRHTMAYGPDGRLFISFRDTTHDSPTKGDWVGWVGTYDDIVQGREGQYRIRFKDNKNRWDTTYPGVDVLPDGTFVVTTYGHWDEGHEPYILSARFTLEELDKRAGLGN